MSKKSILFFMTILFVVFGGLIYLGFTMLLINKTIGIIWMGLFSILYLLSVIMLILSNAEENCLYEYLNKDIESKDEFYCQGIDEFTEYLIDNGFSKNKITKLTEEFKKQYLEGKSN